MLTKSLLKTAKITNYWGSFFAFLIFLWAQATLVYHTIFFTGLIFALIFDKYYYDKYREYIIVNHGSSKYSVAVKNFIFKYIPRRYF